jgi:hypothetical protein
MNPACNPLGLLDAARDDDTKFHHLDGSLDESSMD